MKHMLFAVFESPAVARAALLALEAERVRVDADPLEVKVHQDKIMHTEELPISATNARPAFLRGIVLGAVGGLVLGLVLHFAGLVGAALLPTLVFSSFTGAMAGALGAVLTGASDPDHKLESMIAETNGRERIVVRIEAPDKKSEERAQSLLRKFGAEVRHNSIV